MQRKCDSTVKRNQAKSQPSLQQTVLVDLFATCIKSRFWRLQRCRKVLNLLSWKSMCRYKLLLISSQAKLSLSQ